MQKRVAIDDSSLFSSLSFSYPLFSNFTDATLQKYLPELLFFEIFPSFRSSTDNEWDKEEENNLIVKRIKSE